MQLCLHKDKQILFLKFMFKLDVVKLLPSSNEYLVTMIIYYNDIHNIL